MARRTVRPPDDLGPHLPGWGVVLTLVGGLVGLTWAGWSAGLLEGMHLVVLYAVVVGGFLNVILFSVFLWCWTAITERRTRSARYNEELRHLRTWGGEEGRRRKAGLIRELNAMGTVPAELENAVLAKADLKGTNLRGCNLKSADLRRADLQGAALDGADLWGANLAGANLTMASLRNANMRGCNLENAELVKAQLAEGNLHRANLVNTNLYGTDLTHVRLERARFGERGEGGLLQQVHASVEDWIRERLDDQGLYNEPDSTERAGEESEEEQEPAREPPREESA